MVSHHLIAVHHKLNTAAKTPARHGSNHRKRQVPQSNRYPLKIFHSLFYFVKITTLQGLTRLSKVRSIAEIFVIVANHHRIKLLLHNPGRLVNGLNQFETERLLFGAKFKQRDSMTHVVQSGTLVAPNLLAISFERGCCDSTFRRRRQIFCLTGCEIVHRSVIFIE